MLPKIYFMVKDVFFHKNQLVFMSLAAEIGGNWSKKGF